VQRRYGPEDLGVYCQETGDDKVDRTEKEDLVASMHKTFEDSSIVLVTHYSGLTVAEMGDLRMRMREAGASFKVTKNRLTRRALEGTKYQPLDTLFTGPTAIAYSEDPVAAAKAAVNFSKDNEKLIVLGGALGEEPLDVAAIKSLASLPSPDELRAKFVGMISTPATRIAVVLQAPAGQIARVSGVHSASGGAA
jgi:large subunit ribosomal protein L10